MRRWILWAGVVPLGFASILWAMDWEPVYWAAMPFVYRETTLPAAQTISNIAYDVSAPDDPKRQLDLFLPSAPGFSTVVFVHGGGWNSGDRTLSTGGADVYRNIGRFLAVRGFATAVISYRLLFDIDWRVQAADVAHATAFVQKSIEARGGRPRSLFLMGHSAGAQLVTRIALEPEWLTAAGGSLSGICGVVAASGAAYDMDDDETYKLGADPAYYKRRWGGGADDGWKRDASPVTHITSTAPPFLILYAEGDDPPLRHQASLLARRLLKAGVVAREVVVPGSSHERVVVQLSRDDQTAGPAVLKFLQATDCPRP